MGRRWSAVLAGLFLLLAACGDGSNGREDVAAKRLADTPETAVGAPALAAPDPAPAPAPAPTSPAPVAAAPSTTTPTPAPRPTPARAARSARSAPATTAPASPAPAAPAVASPPAAAATTGSSTPVTQAPARQNELPDAVVSDVNTGENLNVRSLAPADKPLLFWFYAPT